MRQQLVLDGILIGEGDSRALAIAMTLDDAGGAQLPAVRHRWGALYVFMAARLYGCGRRDRRDQWLVTGGLAT